MPEKSTPALSPAQIAFAEGVRMAHPTAGAGAGLLQVKAVDGEEGVLAAFIDGLERGRERLQSREMQRQWIRRDPHLTQVLSHLARFGPSDQQVLTALAPDPSLGQSALNDGIERGLLQRSEVHDQMLYSLSAHGDRLASLLPIQVESEGESRLSLEYVDALAEAANDYRRTGNLNAARATLKRAIEILTRISEGADVRYRARLAAAIAVAVRTEGLDLEVPEKWLFSPDDPYVEALELYRSARSAMVRGNGESHDRAQRQLRQSIALLEKPLAAAGVHERNDLLSRMGWANYSIGLSERRGGHYSASRNSALLAEDLFRSAGDQYGQACSLALTGFIHRLAYDSQTARTHLEAAIEVAEAHDYCEVAGDAYLQLANVYIRESADPDAHVALRRATEMYELAGHACVGRYYVDAIRGILAMREGDLGAAINLTTQSFTELTGLERREGTGLMARRLAILTWRAGDSKRASQHADIAYETYLRMGSSVGMAEALLTRALCHAAQGNEQATAIDAWDALRLLERALHHASDDRYLRRALTHSWHWRVFDELGVKELSSSYRKLIDRVGPWNGGDSRPTDDLTAAALLGQEPPLLAAA